MEGTLAFAAAGPRAAAIAFWLEAGCDWAVGERPCDWLAAEPPSPAFADAQASSTLQQQASRSLFLQGREAGRAGGQGEGAGVSATDAAAVAARCSTPAELAAAYCSLAGPRAILFEGDPTAPILFVIDAPAPQDAARGQLMGGSAGTLFEAMLASIGRARETVCLASLAPAGALPAASPPMGTPFVLRLAKLQRPRAIAAFGSVATTALSGIGSGVARLRGSWIATTAGDPLIPTFSPAFLLNQPAQKALAWADLLAIRARVTA
ncbi:MAG: uracil-DNA glycosylase family protein [Sphingomonadaceae bacterium]|nr:uracil-DNA glycosylase family protein [Sphingomonadaceae bacterium]